MSPSVLPADRCPHCGTDLPSPTPRACPSCGGSLQRRFLSCGCLSSAPPVVLLGVALALGMRGDDEDAGASRPEGVAPAAPAARDAGDGSLHWVRPISR